MPVAEYSDLLRGMSRGGGLGVPPAAVVAMISLVALGAVFPGLVLLGRALRARRR